MLTSFEGFVTLVFLLKDTKKHIYNRLKLFFRAHDPCKVQRNAGNTQTFSFF